MKILFIGNMKGSSTSLHYFTGFIRLGHTVIPYDPDLFSSNKRVERILMKITKSASPKRMRQAHERLCSLIKQNAFDLVFVMAENFICHSTLEEMRTLAVNHPVFVYHSHDNNFSDGILKPNSFAKDIGTYDIVFTTKSQNVARYKSLGQSNTYFIPSAYEPSLHRPITDNESLFKGKMFPVSFIGTYDNSRDPLLDTLGWENLYVWGNHWEKSPRFTQHRDRIVPNAIYYFEYADVLSHSQCCLGLLREEAEDLHTQRTFEIPACGSMQITNRNEEILSFFKENQEIVCFSSKEELKDKVAYYLSHERERARIAKRGFERVLAENHSYVDRCKTILRYAAETRTHTLCPTPNIQTRSLSQLAQS